MMYALLRQLLFKCDAEKTHDRMLPFVQATLGNPLATRLRQRIPDSPVECLGLSFPNPVGLAAGLDKNADYIDGMANLGFGFLEVGTVTPLAQPGNPQPRMFRLPQDEAIINRMGFNNKGVDYLVSKVRNTRYNGILGINIGKNKQTPNEKAIDDYITCLRKVHPYASYVTVNISSPNTPGLRELQYGNARMQLLESLKNEQLNLNQRAGKKIPLVVKIAPDMSREDTESFAEDALATGIDGVIATNTTSSDTAREGLASEEHRHETGGLSGAPLTRLADESSAILGTRLADKIPLVAAGGIMSADDAASRFEHGASLIQLYTGLIYRGPGLIKEVVSMHRARQDESVGSAKTS